MLKKIYKIIIIPYTLFLLYLMFLGMGRFQYEENLLTLEPVFSTIKFIQGPNKMIDIVMIVLGNIIMFIPFGFLGWIFPDLKKLGHCCLVLSHVSLLLKHCNTLQEWEYLR